MSIINPTLIGDEDTSFNVMFFLLFSLVTLTGMTRITGTDRIGPNYRIGQDCAGRAFCKNSEFSQSSTHYQLCNLFSLKIFKFLRHSCIVIACAVWIASSLSTLSLCSFRLLSFGFVLRSPTLFN